MLELENFCVQKHPRPRSENFAKNETTLLTSVTKVADDRHADF